MLNLKMSFRIVCLQAVFHKPESKRASTSTSPCISMFVILVLLSALCRQAQAADAISSSPVPTPDLSSMLSLSNLGEYNQLIDCITKIRASFTHCNEEAQRKGEAVLKYVNEKSELATLLKCCGIWLVRDCWVKAAAQNCTAEQVDKLQNMPSKMMPGLEGLCHKYPAGSSSCYTPHIVFGAIVFSAILLLILIVVLFIFVARHIYRRRKGSTKIDATNLEDERDRDGRIAEKVKLTSNVGENNNPLNNNNLDYIDSEKGN